MYINEVQFCCHTCDFNLHIECALLLSRTIRHKYDKHPLNLSYFPIENHESDYFCDICETELDPNKIFYHCKKCDQSMHSACAPMILHCEADIRYLYYNSTTHKYMKIKFGGTHNIQDHPHPLSFAEGLLSDGECTRCNETLQYKMIFKCLQCRFAIDFNCCKRLSGS